MRPRPRPSLAALAPTLLGAAYALALVAYEHRGADAPRGALGFALAWAAALGLGLGAALGSIAWLRRRLRGGQGAASLGATALLLAGWHLAASLWAMASTPSLAAAAWYARGGVRRLVQVLAADVAGPKALAALGAAALVGYAVGASPKRLAARLRDLRRPREMPREGPRDARPKATSTLRRKIVGRLLQARARADGPRGRAGAALRVVAPVALAATALLWLARPAPRHRPGARPDLVLVGFASLEAGSLGPELTPALAAFASRGVTFDQAFVTSTDAPLERAAWVSGIEPHRWRLGAEPSGESLPERLASAGYRVAIVGDDTLAGRLGLAAHQAPTLERWPLALEPLRPLAKALASRLGLPAPTRRDLVDADDAIERALRFADAGEGPFALALFLPAARPPFAGACERALAFADRAYRGRCKYRGCSHVPGAPPPDADDLRQELALHKGALACDDAAFGRLLDRLRERGLDATTIVAAFGEGGAPVPRAPGLDGGPPLDDRTLRAPLVVRMPGAGPPARRSEIVRDLDLAPTIAEWLRLPGYTESPGRSLAGALRGEPLAESPAFSEAGSGEAAAAATALGRRWALSTGPHRLVAQATRRGLAVELFDRHADPEQTRDVSAELPALRDALRDELVSWLLRDRTLTMRSGHVVPRPPEVAPQSPSKPSGAARKERQRSLLDALQTSLPDRHGPGAAPGAGMSTLAPDPWARPPHPARRRVSLGSGGGRDETRSALIVPTPSALRLSRRLEAHARLRVAPAPLAPPERPLRVEVRARRRGAPPEVLDAWALGADEARRWVEREIDLGRFAGLEIELELRTLSEPTDDAPSVAWGSPALVEASAAELPYNVVLAVFEGADLTRPAPRRARQPEAGQPAPRGVSFPDCVAAATWQGPELLAILAGMRSGELGLDVGGPPPSRPSIDAFYARRPPLLAPLLRAAGATTLVVREAGAAAPEAFGSLDLGFDAAIEVGARSAAAELEAWLERHRRERFFALVRLRAGGPAGRSNAADAREALEPLFEPLAKFALEGETIVVAVAADGAPGGTDAPERFLRAPSLPLVIEAPGLAAGPRPEVPAHATDLAPTLLALEGLAAVETMSGRALLGPTAAPPESLAARARVTEGRGARSLRSGPLLFVERDAGVGASDEARSFLFDAAPAGAPPRDRSGERPAAAERLRDELAREIARHRSAEATRSEALAGSRFTPPPPSPRARVGLRFYGGPERHRVTLRIDKPAPGPGEIGPTLRITPVGLGPDVLYDGPSFVDAAFLTRPDLAAGFDVELAPSTTPLPWHVTWDDRPLEGHAWLAGPWALGLPALAGGLLDEASRRFAEAAAPPADLSPGRDEGVLVLWQELGVPP
ncbi:MAG TPA: sulfatase-like hydrolase/transferase [Polyangiaceae bacterium]|nr:sulfatase-like hydrolase/transferase [Polyangiaceae bacterium]